ncbi:MAG: hypothetical protein L6Q37_01310 [Bdellovibrionaceae bacterium]|nr:hypothetical protein [Pseudobdellovibrionaceae bacterium]NUM59387.1 hypothetical protein [Pseudobdellovibrionaceae bacterium]
MNQWNGLASYCFKKKSQYLLALAFSFSGITSLAQVIDQEKNDLQMLEKRVSEIQLDEDDLLQSKSVTQDFISLGKSISDLRIFKAVADSKQKHCVDFKKMEFAGKYILTFDENGKQCRIYDLSFPNLKAFFTRKKVTSVPAVVPKAKDYLNWLNGTSEDVLSDQKNLSIYELAKSSWVNALRFKKPLEIIPGSKKFVFENGLPLSFSLSDLEVGAQFSFSETDVAEVRNLLADYKSSMASAMGQGNGAEFIPEALNKVVEKPESLLNGVQFVWNDVSKAYEVFLTGDFLPINGPVALIDFQTQYKFALEKMFRNVLSSALYRLAFRIPNKMVSSVVAVVIDDAFEQLELAYSYQLVQLEEALKTLSLDSRAPVAETIMPNKALDLLYGQQSSLFSAYITSVVQKKEMDWENFQKLGKTARYNVEKQRDVMMGRLNSRLVLEKKCDIEFFKDYFAICSKEGKKIALYSLISDHSFAFKNLGAPAVYNFNRPFQVTLMRGGAWVLSAALRIVGLPIPRSIIYRLDGILKRYRNAGILDEALLRSHFGYQKSLGILNSENGSMLNWLFVQNLNPFLPKSEASELSLIAKNRQILGINEVQ